MPVIAATFTNEKELTETLNTLYELKIESNNVVVMSPEGNVNLKQNGTASTYYQGGIIADTGIGLKEQSFYNDLIKAGQSIVFVETEMEDVTTIERAMQGANRVDRL